MTIEFTRIDRLPTGQVTEKKLTIQIDIEEKIQQDQGYQLQQAVTTASGIIQQVDSNRTYC